MYFITKPKQPSQSPLITKGGTQKNSPSGGWGAFLLTCLLIGFALPAQAQNNALHFDGADDYVFIPHNAALKPATHVTVEAWVYVNNITSNQYYEIARKEEISRILFSFQEFGTVLSFGLDVGGSYSELDVTITASDYVNRWVHVAAVYNGTQKIIYRNGVVIGTQNVTGAIGTSGTQPLVVGSSSGSSEFFNGRMDEFRFWNVARTQAQIQSGMTTELTGTETGLVVYYKFNEGVANGNNTAITAVNDLATTLGGTNNGTLTNFARSGTTSNWVGGNPNNALNFDHTGSPNRDFVSIPHNSNLDITSTLTLSAWVRPNGASFFDNILLKGNYGYGFAVDNTNSLGYWSDSDYANNCPRFGTIADNVWTHVAVVVVQGVSTTFYINGVQVGQSTTAGHTTINTGGASTVTTIGRQGDFDGNYFGGDMDEVMVWNIALNATQVNTAMNIGFLGNEAGLVAYYKFNHGVANVSNTGITTLTDLAGGDNNDTLTNFMLLAGTVSNWVSGIALAPEINLQGNATAIADGDATPSTADHTDFGATLASTPIVRTFTIQNTGLRTLNISSISNTNTADFTVGTAPTFVAIGGSATFTVTLNSVTLGTKNATITVNNDDPNESAYDFAITGRIISTSPTGVRGNMASFNGTNQSIEVANNSNLNSYATTGEITIEYWAYARDITTVQDIIAKRPLANNGGFVIEINSGSAAHFINTNTGWQFINVPYDLNQWMHIAMVGKASTGELIIYKNGVPTGTSLSGAFASFNATSAVLRMGRDSETTNARFWNGNLDEVRIWNTARTQAQIRESMHLTLSGAESGLVGYWQFNETMGNAIDAVNGNNGALQNGATRPESTVSVARGISTRLTVPTGASTQTFGNATVNFTAMSAPAANDEFVTYQLQDTPLNNVSANNTASNYWLVRQFGTQTFSYNQMNFTLSASNIISTTDVTTPSNLKLFKRNHNSGGTWGTAIGTGTSANNTTKVINYNISPAQTSFSEFIPASVTSPLPITLIGFEGRRVEGLRGEMTEEVRLEWSTASEINNKGFEVEMSSDGLAYEKITFVEGKGNSLTSNIYQLTTIQSNDAYYRLKQVDFDGKFSYSPVVFVEDVETLKIYPNPSNGDFTVQAGKEVSARLLDAQGKQVWAGKAENGKINVSLPAGVYFLHTTVAGKTQITKVVIER
jgi:hypothetical protein